MNCEDFRGRIIEAARGGDVPGHVDSCADCRAFLAVQIRLSAAMLKVRQAFPPVDLPPIRQAKRPVAPHVWIPMAIAAAFAGAFFLMPKQEAQKTQPPPVTLATVPRPPGVAPEEPVVSPKPIRKKRKPKVEPAENFYSIPYTQPLAEGERAEIRRVEMPVAALIAAGFPVSMSGSGELANADVIVGEDGRARAIRLISISDTGSQRSIYK